MSVLSIRILTPISGAAPCAIRSPVSTVEYMWRTGVVVSRWCWRIIPRGVTANAKRETRLGEERAPRQEHPREHHCDHFRFHISVVLSAPSMCKDLTKIA